MSLGDRIAAKVSLGVYLSPVHTPVHKVGLGAECSGMIVLDSWC